MKRQFFGDEKKMRRYGSFKKSKEEEVKCFKIVNLKHDLGCSFFGT
jgi:hypothetical protein